MKSRESGGLTALLCIVVAMMQFVAMALLTKLLWGWFVVPKFGLPALSIPEALGIYLLASIPHVTSDAHINSGFTKLEARRAGKIVTPEDEGMYNLAGGAITLLVTIPMYGLIAYFIWKCL